MAVRGRLLAAGIVAIALAAGCSTAEPAEVWAVRGAFAWPPEQEVVFKALEQVAAADCELTSGDHELVLMDGAGTEVFKLAFARPSADSAKLPPPNPLADIVREVPFCVPLPANVPPFVGAQVRVGGEQLGAMGLPNLFDPDESPSRHDDLLQVRFTGTEAGGYGDVSLDWWAFNGGSGELSYTVEYRLTEAGPWQEIATDIRETHTKLEPSHHQKTTNVRARVTATDGVRTATAISEPFDLIDNPPCAVDCRK